MPDSFVTTLNASLLLTSIQELIFRALGGDFGSVPDSFMTTLNALLMLTFLEHFRTLRGIIGSWRVPGGRVDSDARCQAPGAIRFSPRQALRITP